MNWLVNLYLALPSWALAVGLHPRHHPPAVAGLVVVHRLVPGARRRTNNEVAGPMSGMVGIVFAVMLAFVAIAVWERFNTAETLVQKEASAAADIWFQAAGYPEPLRSRVQDGIRAYLESVITEEWPRQQRGEMTQRPWQIFGEMHLAVLHFEPRTKGEEAVHHEQLKDFNTLMDQRRARLHAVHQGIDARVWTVMIIGTAVMVAFTWFFGTDSFRAHVVMTVLFGIAIGLVFYLVSELDYPFRGDTGVPPEAFQEVLEGIKRQSGPKR